MRNPVKLKKLLKLVFENDCEHREIIRILSRISFEIKKNIIKKKLFKFRMPTL